MSTSVLPKMGEIEAEIMSKLKSLNGKNLLMFLNKQHKTILSLNSEPVKLRLVQIFSESSDFEIKTSVGVMLGLQFPCSNIQKVLPFLGNSSMCLLKKALFQVIIFCCLINFVNCENNVLVDNDNGIFFSDTTNFYKISCNMYQKNTYMLTEQTSLKNFSKFLDDLKDLNEKIAIFLQYSPENNFCQDYIGQSQEKISDIDEELSKNYTFTYNMNHLEYSQKQKQFISFIINNKCYFSYNFKKLSEIKSLELNFYNLKYENVNNTYFNSNLFSENKLSHKKNCISWGSVTSNFIRGYYMRSSKLSGCIRKCQSTSQCFIYEYNYSNNECKLFKQGAIVTYGNKANIFKVFGEIECRLVYDMEEPLLKYNNSLEQISKFCHFIETRNQVNFKCENFFDYLEKPLKTLEDLIQKFTSKIHQQFDFQTQNFDKSKRSLSLITTFMKASKIILPIIESGKIAEIINIRKYLGLLKNTSLNNILNWFQTLGIKSSFGKQTDYFSINLFSRLKDKYFLEPYNYQLFHYFENVKKLQNKIYAEIDRISLIMNYPNATDKNLPSNFIYSRYIKSENIMSHFIFQNFSRNYEKIVLLIPKENINILESWSLGKLNSNVSNSKCLTQALTTGTSKNCQKIQNIKTLESDIYQVSLDLNKFKLGILIINKPGILQISCSNFNRLDNIIELTIIMYDMSCSLFFNHINIIKPQTIESFIVSKILYSGKFIKKLDYYSNLTKVIQDQGFQRIISNITYDSIISKVTDTLIPGININDFTQYLIMGLFMFGYLLRKVYFTYFQQVKGEEITNCQTPKITEIEEIPLVSSCQNKIIFSKDQ